MHHRDGTLLARYPHVTEMIGKNFRKGPASQQQVFELPYSTTRLASPIDGKDRLISSRSLTHFPIVIVATTTTEAALADWREQIGILIAVAGLSVLAISILLFLVVRKLSQQHRTSQQRLTLEKQRLDTAVNNMTQGLLLFDSSQRLVICNHRYIEMYGLSADVIKPGCSFRELIAHRKQTGSFDGDVDDYVAGAARIGTTKCHGHRRRPTDVRSRSSTSRWRMADGWRPMRTSPSATVPRSGSRTWRITMR